MKTEEQEAVVQGQHVVMTKQDFIKEHKQLTKDLRLKEGKKKRKRLAKQLKEQSEELKHVLSKAIVHAHTKKMKSGLLVFVRQYVMDRNAVPKVHKQHQFLLDHGYSVVKHDSQGLVMTKMKKNGPKTFIIRPWGKRELVHSKKAHVKIHGKVKERTVEQKIKDFFYEESISSSLKKYVVDVDERTKMVTFKYDGQKITAKSHEFGDYIAFANYLKKRDKLNKKLAKGKDPKISSYEEYDNLSKEEKEKLAIRDSLDSSKLTLEDKKLFGFYGFSDGPRQISEQPFDHEDVARFLRKGSKGTSTVAKAVAKMLEAMEKRAPRTKRLMRVYRVVDSQDFKNIKPGDVFTDKSFMSTSLDQKFVSDFGGDMFFSINLPKGTPFVHLESDSTKAMDKSLENEYEILLQPGSHFKVSHVVHGNQDVVVTLDYLPPGTKFAKAVLCFVTDSSIEKANVSVTPKRDILLAKIKCKQLNVNPEKVKKLEATLKRVGVLPPIHVEEHSDGYLAVDGHHRYTAYKNLKRNKIPCIVHPEGWGMQEKLIVKAVVHQHTRKTKLGKLTLVKEYTDSRRYPFQDKIAWLKKHNYEIKGELEDGSILLEKVGKLYIKRFKIDKSGQAIRLPKETRQQKETPKLVVTTNPKMQSALSAKLKKYEAELATHGNVVDQFSVKRVATLQRRIDILKKKLGLSIPAPVVVSGKPTATGIKKIKKRIVELKKEYATAKQKTGKDAVLEKRRIRGEIKKVRLVLRAERQALKEVKKAKREKKAKKKSANPWIANYGQYKLTRFPTPETPESAVKVDLKGDINSHAVLLWKDPKTGDMIRSYTREFMRRNAEKKWKRMQKVTPDLIEKVKQRSLQELENKDKATAQSAAILYTIANTGLRIGNPKLFVRTGNKGMLTLSPNDVSVKGDTVFFSFTGKSYQENAAQVKNALFAAYMNNLKKLRKGQKFLFTVDYRDVRKTLKRNVIGLKAYKAAGKPLPKDMRTYVANELALDILNGQKLPKEMPVAKTKQKKIIKGILKNVFKQVAEKLNNTPGVTKGSYVHPLVLREWMVKNGIDEEEFIIKKAALNDGPLKLYDILQKYPDFEEVDIDEDEEEMCDEYPLPAWLEEDDEFEKSILLCVII